MKEKSKNHHRGHEKGHDIVGHSGNPNETPLHVHQNYSDVTVGQPELAVWCQRPWKTLWKNVWPLSRN